MDESHLEFDLQNLYDKGLISEAEKQDVLEQSQLFESRRDEIATAHEIL